MKRYLAFYGSIYYPSGGMDDFIGDFDSIEEAESEINNKAISDRVIEERWKYSWAHVYDTKTKQQVWDK